MGFRKFHSCNTLRTDRGGRSGSILKTFVSNQIRNWKKWTRITFALRVVVSRWSDIHYYQSQVLMVTHLVMSTDMYKLKIGRIYVLLRLSNTSRKEFIIIITLITKLWRILRQKRKNRFRWQSTNEKDVKFTCLFRAVNIAKDFIFRIVIRTFAEFLHKRF